MTKAILMFMHYEAGESEMTTNVCMWVEMSEGYEATFSNYYITPLSSGGSTFSWRHLKISDLEQALGTTNVVNHTQLERLAYLCETVSTEWVHYITLRTCVYDSISDTSQMHTDINMYRYMHTHIRVHTHKPQTRDNFEVLMMSFVRMHTYKPQTLKS